VVERHGHAVEVSEQGRTAALINGEHVSFGIEEPIHKVVTRKTRVQADTCGKNEQRTR
jgi:hypothetical protein